VAAVFAKANFVNENKSIEERLTPFGAAKPTLGTQFSRNVIPITEPLGAAVSVGCARDVPVLKISFERKSRRHISAGSSSD